MGVINEKKVVCESGNATDDERIDVPIDFDYVPRTTRTTRQVERNTTYSVYVSFIQRRNEKNVRYGKRKSQRLENRVYVEGLSDIIEETYEVTSEPSKFQVLMENFDDALELLNRFEEEREKNMQNSKTNLKREYPQFHVYYNIPKKIRKTIQQKQSFRLDVLRNIEEELLIDLIDQNKNGLHMMPKTSYERYLTQAAAIYHGFFSKVLTTGSEKVIDITKSGGCGCDIQRVLLCDYLEGKQIKKL